MIFLKIITIGAALILSSGLTQHSQIPPPASIPQIANNVTFIISNQCDMPIWPAFVTAQNVGPYAQGFVLPSGSFIKLWVSSDWNGRIWARTNCSFDSSTNEGFCATGSCMNRLNCSVSGEPPTTLAEFKFSGWSNLSFWDISLVSGFNLPISVRALPSGPEAVCAWSPSPECIKALCPEELIFYSSSEEIAGCMSACEAFNAPEFCCTPPNSTPSTCPPSNYSEYFKKICPDAYAYAFDDSTSTFTNPLIPGASYEIIFCPR
jgi:Thaumatin family